MNEHSITPPVGDPSITRPAGRRVYIDGTLPGVRVPAREVVLAEPNPPLRLYDTSGPYGDPQYRADFRRGLPALRAEWIRARGDVEELTEATSAYRRAARGRSRARVRALPRSAPLPARQGRTPRDPAPLRAPRRHHSGDGVHRAARGSRSRACARRSGPRPRDHPRQHQSPRGGADDHRASLPGEDQRQPRQLGGLLLRGGGAGEDALVGALGRRHGDGSLHRRQHPRDPRVDAAQRAGPAGHGADLSGAREGGRRGRGPHLGPLPRHPDRAVRAGGGLLHHPRRRAAALHPAHREPRDRDRLARRLHPRQVVPRPPHRELPLHPFPRHLRDPRRLRRRLLAGRRAAPRLASPTPTTPRSSPSWTRWASSRRSPGSTTARS